MVGAPRDGHLCLDQPPRRGTHPRSRTRSWSRCWRRSSQGEEQVAGDLYTSRPPYGYALDLAPELTAGLIRGRDRAEVSVAEAVAKMIEKYQPLLGCTAHHESRGVQRIKKTTIINPAASTRKAC